MCSMSILTWDIWAFILFYYIQKYGPPPLNWSTPIVRNWRIKYENLIGPLYCPYFTASTCRAISLILAMKASFSAIGIFMSCNLAVSIIISITKDTSKPGKLTSKNAVLLFRSGSNFVLHSDLELCYLETR